MNEVIMISMNKLHELIKGLVLIVILTSMALAPARPAYAATLTVNRLWDTNDGVCNSSDCTLREAINAANATGASDLIEFSLEGIITLGSSLPGIDSYSTAGALTIDGNGQDITISGNNLHRPFFVETGGYLILQDVSVKNGYHADFGGGFYNKGTLVMRDCVLQSNRAVNQGGGIYTEGNLTLENTDFSSNATDTGNGGGLYVQDGYAYITGGTFQLNNAASSGGAIYNSYTSGDIRGNLSIEGTDFSLNQALDNNGGAIASKSYLEIDGAAFVLNIAYNNGGGIHSEIGFLKIENSLFKWNTSSSQNGGGLYLSITGTTSYTVSDSSFIQNTAQMDGGGFYFSSATGNVFITHSIFSDNRAHGNGGGGFNSTGTVNLYFDTFDSNTADYLGGGFYNNDEMYVYYSTFSGNTAFGNGGGVYHSATGDPDVSFYNDTFYDNLADLGGGFFANSGSEINNCTFGYNTASVDGGGGALYAGTTTKIRNSIIANSVSGGNCDDDTLDPTNNGNNIEDGITCNWGSVNGSRSNADPLLGELKDNGGSTKTMMLLPGSPAIDGVTYNAPNGCPPNDQRGFPRPFGVRYDIGAVEQYYRLILPIVKNED